MNIGTQPLRRKPGAPGRQSKAAGRMTAALLSAVLLLSGTAALAAPAPEFRDVGRESWYHDAVETVTEAGLFHGTAEGIFSPNATMTRGMFVTALGRLADVQTSDKGRCTVRESAWLREKPSTESAKLRLLNPGEQLEITGSANGWYTVTDGAERGCVSGALVTACACSFSDVAYDSYARGYADWANLAGITAGTGDRRFSPDAPITRAALCAMLDSLTAYKGYLPRDTVPQTAFSDDGRIADPQREAVYTMQRLGVVQGRENGCFDPQGSATRAEVAAMLSRYMGAVAGTEAEPVNPPDAALPVFYEYGTPIPAAPSVGEAYFDDACFLGHSLVVGMDCYCGLDRADFHAVNGISAAGFLSYDGFALADGSAGTLAQALGDSKYAKYYIMLGANEVTDGGCAAFQRNMRAVIGFLRDRSPDASIYLISVTPVTRARSELGDGLTAANIRAYNACLLSLSAECRVGYLDVWSLYADGSGFLPEDMALSDGVHLTKYEYPKLKDYLMTHTFER